MVELRQNGSASNMREIRYGLEQLERREWWRWASALLIMLLLTAGVFALALPGVRRDAFTQAQLEVAVKGLFGLVLLFDVFAIYQQVLISRLRRLMASQIATLAATELQGPTSAQGEEEYQERRRIARRPLDQRLKVTTVLKGKEETFHGRVIDLTEIGLGAVIAGSLRQNQYVVLELHGSVTQGTLKLGAVVRYARGFRHGFEFLGLSDTELEDLRSACAEVNSTVV
ncbi:MAG TPA: PilZ domain-containing protein [Candidatus Saccharimonadales bacterium]|jgi:hypothetical protein|nr:PilZ domain-containing protein [Candidatus Saccharimonadales bacterium]